MALTAIPPKAPASAADLQKRIQELEAQLQAKSAPQPLKLKVSEKGALSIYNVNARFPVTLYADQWKRIIAAGSDILAFIEANSNRLSHKI